MLRGIGPRFYVEAGFLIAVAAVLAVQRVRPVEIVLVMLVAYVAVFAVELLLARRRTSPGTPEAQRQPVDVEPVHDPDVSSSVVAVQVVEPDEAVAVPVQTEAVQTEAVRTEAVETEAPAPIPATEWVDDPPRRPVVVSHDPPELEPEPEPVPAPEPEPAPPVLAAVPTPDPEPEPVAASVPEPIEAPETVAVASFPQQPRSWNVWELERLVRDRHGDDPVRDEEWGYLLVYLRDFASPEGLLPEDFDALVRESFGDVLEAAAAR